MPPAAEAPAPAPAAPPATVRAVPEESRVNGAKYEVCVEAPALALLQEKPAQDAAVAHARVMGCHRPRLEPNGRKTYTKNGRVGQWADPVTGEVLTGPDFQQARPDARRARVFILVSEAEE